MTMIDHSWEMGIELQANHRDGILVRARSLDMAGLLALVADALAGGLGRAIA
jgi:hypothetical protein